MVRMSVKDLTMVMELMMTMTMTAITMTAITGMAASQEKKSTAGPPHIVFIIADDLGWNDVEWRNPSMRTPTLKRLKEEGILLENAYMQKLCSPSRSAIMSGLYPFRTGLQHNVILTRQGVGLPEELTILPQVMKKRGYATHAVGKWHLGFCKWEYTPTERGFDSFLGYLTGGETYYHHSSGALNFSSGPGYDFRVNRTVDFKDFGSYSTNVFAERAVQILRNHDRSQPLFLYLAFQSVHEPLEVPEKYEENYCSHMPEGPRRKYCAMAAAMDEAVGNITDTLDTLGYLDNLLLVFTSDNGGQVLAGGNNWPLRGAKDTLWEGGNRVPSFLYSKNLFGGRGGVYDGIVHAVDWLPTLMSVADAEEDIPYDIDGVSQWKSIVEGKKGPRKEFVYNIDSVDNNAAIRVGHLKLIQGRPGELNGWYPAPEDGQQMEEENGDLNNLGPFGYLLFNVTADPSERTDIKDDHPEELGQLKRRLELWRESEVPAMNPPPDPASDVTNFHGVWSPGWC
ncbi:arylsulfatase B-like [Babylonia areolata]|uniref:arylsulfatase B-like n=1 Tax=Babylonia areolata TaxID=304850 RepID=UPI003FCEF658